MTPRPARNSTPSRDTNDEVLAAAYSDDGATLTSVGRDGAILVWRLG